MNDRNLVRGLFLLAVALGFGIPASNYPVGDFSHPGPSLFPLAVCGLLFLIALITIIKSRLERGPLLDFNLKNITLILVSLCGFALLSDLLNMTVGIAFMVFCSGFAARSYSVVRNIQVSIGLIAVAYAFQKLLGLNLSLF